MFSQFLTDFRALHHVARRGQLHGDDRRHYEAVRDELARAVCESQRVQPPPGQTWRSILRVQRAVRVDLHLPSGPLTTTTTELTATCITAVVPNRVPFGTRVGVRLHTAFREHVVCHGCVLASTASPPRLSLQLEALHPRDEERIEMVIFDALLAHCMPA
jgi:hypothetical protein